jgi:4-amino-4-deoxy-L-arabinose transferase-like glycosyltransferase
MSKLARQILTTRGVAAFWLLWCAAFVLMLWAVSPGRTLQDALAAELLQGHLAGGYQLRNPPLYEWLLWAMQELVGSGPLSYLMLRYALIAATGILFYVALRRTVASQRLAAAFSLSLVLLYWFGWEIHHSVSHSLALLAASLALFIAALIYAERPTPMRALLLGLIIGIGLMAKWSFLLVVLSLGLALAITPETRRIYRDPQTLIVLVSAALPIVPFLLWLDSVDPGLVGSRAVPQGSGLSAARALQGALVFLTGIPLVFLPWIAFVLFFAWRFPKVPPSSPTLPEGVAIRLAGLTAIATLAVMAVLLLVAIATGAALFGITRFAIHYLFPFCLFAALALAGLAARRVNEERFAPRLAITSLAFALVIFLLKLGSFYVIPPASEATNLLPYDRLAEELTRRGLGKAQFVTLSPRDAGNLAVALPEARALSLSARIEPPPPDSVPDRPCVLLWGGEYSVPPAPLPPANPSPARFLKLLGVAASAGDAEGIDVEWRKPLIGAQRRSVWHLLRGDDIDAACRKVAAEGVL